MKGRDAARLLCRIGWGAHSAIRYGPDIGHDSRLGRRPEMGFRQAGGNDVVAALAAKRVSDLVSRMLTAP